MAGKKKYQPTTDDTELRSQKSKSCCKCSTGCLCAISIVLFILLIASSGGIAALLRMLQVATRPIEFVEAVAGCTYCPKCHLCLAGFTGQDVTSLCETKDLSRTLQCAAQVFFLYSSERADPSIPCYSECSRCRNCLNTLSLGSLELTSTLWETVYTNYFENSTVIDPFNRCSIKCYDGSNCQWLCDPITENETSTIDPRQEYPLTRSKRQAFMEDRDACCATERSEEPYLISFTLDGDDDGTDEEWYPVWFYKSYAEVKYSFQYYTNVNCPRDTSLCDRDVQCIQHNEKLTMLMTTYAPHEIYGHTFIILTYPNSMARFVDVDLPFYCRCVT